eukprot:comp20492_c0_seq1/m.26162 comp20492_c0_seq1/g.26162  ORF comp20492_c0_seq1/g.26162 comp20492_c0_seq1/m.26162 type:complete len:451 (-) comp20492_c0_seq1:38-1390(-)
MFQVTRVPSHHDCQIFLFFHFFSSPSFFFFLYERSACKYLCRALCSPPHALSAPPHTHSLSRFPTLLFTLFASLAAYCTMSQGRPYQLAVFGASGFTGVLVVEELVKYLRSSGKQLAWAVAGRSESKLKAALTDVAHRLGDATVKDTPILIADVKDTKSMADLCKQVSVILNVTGPYRFFGEPVVKACMENGADYLDITGEPEFIERMILKYAQAARANGVVAVTTCGFDSVPCDLGVEYTLGQFPDRSLVSSVESYLSLHSENGLKGHYATFESAVHGFGNQAELSKIRKELAQREAAQGWLPRLPILGPKLRMTSGPVLQPQLQKWILPFPGADATVVRRTQRELYHSHQITPTQFAAYMTIPSTFYVGVVMAVGIVFRCLASYKWGRQLLLKFPRLFSWGVFSHEGPSAQDLATTSFDMQFIARAYSTRQGAEAGGGAGGGGSGGVP